MSAEPEALHFPPFEARVATLANGLEILVREDRSAPVASLQGWVRSGSIHEGPWLGAGLSHFLEHMLFKGAAGRSAGEIAKAIQAEGGYINAYTSFDRTVYWIDAPAAGAMACLDLLCDVLGHAEIPEDEFENERDVIRREIAMGEDSPEQVIGKLLFRTAYSVHPCRHPVIGHLDLFNQLRRDDLAAYYHERYAPDNLFLVVAGDVSAEQVVDRIGERLGGLARRRRPAVVLPEEPIQTGPRRETLAFPTELHRERIAWQVPDGLHPDMPALDLLAGVLGQGRSSRLVQSVRERLHLAHSVGAYCYSPAFRGQFALVFDTEPEKADAARAAALAEVERVCEEGVSERELEKARRQILAAQFSAIDDVRGQASDIGSNWLLARDPDHTRGYVEAVQRVGSEAVAQAARDYLHRDRDTRVALVPKAVPAPAPAKAASKRSEDFRRLELENGLTVLLLADHRVPFVHATGVFRGGLLAETAATSGITRLMARLLAKDTLKRSAEDLAIEIETVGGSIDASAGNNSFGVSVHAMRPDLERVVDLLGETLLEPAFLPETVAREKAYQLSQIKAEADRPFSVAMKALRRGLYGAHPYGLESSGSAESVSGLDSEALEAMRGRLVVGGNGVVGVFGDLDLDRAEAMVRSRFAHTLPPGSDAFAETAFELPERLGELVELRHEKEQAVLLVGYRTVPLSHPDLPALEMIDEACSDMASRLFTRIREELGLAYSVGAARLDGFEPGFLVFYVSTAPEKLDLVQEEVLSEIDLIVREGLEPEEFERAKASWLGREAIRLQGARELASAATIDELVGLGWDRYRRVPGIVASLDREAVREAAARHLREENQVIVRLTK